MNRIIFLATVALRTADLVAARLQGVVRRVLGAKQQESTLIKHNRLFKRAADRLGLTVRDLGKGILEISDGHDRIFVSSTNFSFESLTAYWMCGDKHLSAELLTGDSLPVPENILVLAKDFLKGTAAFRSLGTPVVVKPVLGACGRGVTVNVSSDSGFLKAFINAARFCDSILIERFVTGSHYRVTLLDSELIVAWQRIPAFVVGDGVTDVRGLTRLHNSTLHRADGTALGLPIRIGRQTRRDLVKLGGSFDSVPEKGENVTVVLACNSALGGRTRDVTNEIHPGYVEVAGRAARTLGARFAGVDIIAEDITSAPVEGGYFINEVNTTPDLLSPDYALDRKRSALDYAEVVLRKALKTQPTNRVASL